MKGRNMQRRKRTRFSAAAAVALGILPAALMFGCGSKNDSQNLEERKAIIQDYAGIILLQDQDSARYDHVLKAIASYLEAPSPEQKEAAQMIIEEAVRQMDADSEACGTYEVSEELSRMLQDQGISREEYEMNAGSRYTELQGFLQDTVFLEEYLEYADLGEVFMEDLERAYDFMSEEQKIMQSYHYTGINYWFAGWGEQEVECVKEQVLDKLVSFRAEDGSWESSQDAVVARMNAYLDRIEELNSRWAASVGEAWDELNKSKEEME